MSTSKRWTIRTAATAALATSLLVGTAAPAFAATWTVLATPNPTAEMSQFTGVDAVSASDAWAVGSSQANWSSPTQGLAARWNGTAWSLVSLPAVSGSWGLDGVDGDTATNVWAVGSTGSGTLTQRWNGSSWSTVASPTPAGATGAVLRGVKTLSASNAWAVGEYGTSASPNRRTLIVQWNGTGWTQFTTPNPDGLQNQLVAIDGVAANDLWALGNMGHDGYGGDTVAGLMLRWNGTAWTQVALPSGGGFPTGFSIRKLHDIVAVASNDVWAVGTAFSFQTFSFVPYFVRWNGQSWSEGTIPSPGMGGFRTVTALSATKVYAFGDENGQRLIARWNGTAWSRETAPTAPGTLVAAAVTSTATVWAVGTKPGASSGTQTFAIRSTNG